MENKKGISKRNLFHIIISILIGCAMWFYVDNRDSFYGSEIVKTFYDIPIEYVGEETTLADRGLMLLSSSDDAITIQVKARRGIIAMLNPDKIRVQVDLRDITSTGIHSVSTNILYPSVPSMTSGEFRQNISVVNNSAYSVTLEIGELYSRNVDIRCALEGAVADGYIAGELRIEPETLEIRGQQELVDQVAYAKVTLQVDNAEETVTQTLDYQLYSASNQLIEDPSLHAVVDQVQVTLPVNVVKELPLHMNFVEAPGASIRNLDYTISPASVTVSGDAALLRNVDAIVLDDFELATFSTPTKYNYAIPIPDGCENLSGETRATLDIKFRDIMTLSVLAGHFTSENGPEGKTVTVLTTEMPVILRGTSADVGAVLPDDVTVAADLTDVSAASGSYTVPAIVTISTDGDVGVVGEYQVRVTISNEPEGGTPPDDTQPDGETPAEDGETGNTPSEENTPSTDHSEP